MVVDEPSRVVVRDSDDVGDGVLGLGGELLDEERAVGRDGAVLEVEVEGLELLWLRIEGGGGGDGVNTVGG